MISLIDGLVPPLLLVLATAGVVVHLWPRPADWYRTRLVPGLAVGVLLTALVSVVVHHVPGLIADREDEYPFGVNITVAIGLAVLYTAITSRTDRRRWQRWLSPVSVLLIGALAGDQLAVHYGYPPDLRTLLGFDVQGAHRFALSDVAPSVASTTTSDPAPSPPTVATTNDTVAPTSTSASASASTSTSASASASASTLRPATTDAHVENVSTTTSTVGPAPVAAAVSATWQPAGAVPANGDVVTEVAIPGTTSGVVARPAIVYLPPAYRASPTPPKLPVVVLLAGVPGQPKNWTSGLEVHRVYDEFAAAHRGLAPILVMVDHTGSFTGDKGCIDSVEGKVETYLTVDVPAFVTATFGTASGPAAWGIAGFSDGGTCATVLGLRHPDLFGFAADFSGDPGPNLDGSVEKYTTRFLAGAPDAYAAHDPVALLAAGKVPARFALWLEAGEHEPAKKKAAEAIASAASAAGIHVELHSSAAGGHTFSFWRQCVRDSVVWINAQVGIG